MAKHLQQEMDKLKERSLRLSAHVESSVGQAVKALVERDLPLAESVISGDDQINRWEVELEEECLKILALHQPVANDLRYVIAVLKLNNDLERIGDLAVNIAERVRFLAKQPPVEISFDYSKMASCTQAMVKKAHESLLNRDAGLAREVCRADEEVDGMNRQAYQMVEKEAKAHPDGIESLLHLLSCARHLERIADHATNIAEDVIYLVDGEIIRHRAEDYGKK